MLLRYLLVSLLLGAAAAFFALFDHDNPWIITVGSPYDRWRSAMIVLVFVTFAWPAIVVAEIIGAWADWRERQS